MRLVSIVGLNPLLPDVDTTLRKIAKWKFIIKTDLLKGYYQIPLSKDSMRYCGVSTPFRGTRVYCRAAMGLPGSETALEEVMCRVLGDLMSEGCVAKIADDIFCGADNLEDLIVIWGRVLEALSKNNLGLNAPKTWIVPKEVMILGWIWSDGTIKASPHRVSTLSVCDPPKSVGAMRSYIGSYKCLFRVLRGCAGILDPFEVIVANRESRDVIVWTEELLKAFKDSQAFLSNNMVITMPRPSDKIIIVTDAAVKPCGLAATLFVDRDGKLLVGGYFNAKMKLHQVKWLPCEVEALCIGAAVSHFSPFLIQSNLRPVVYTDSMPCVKAFSKMSRGEFSSSARVATFLSNLSHFQAELRHISGHNNGFTDYSSRNPAECSNDSCQICGFVRELEESVVRGVSVSDVLEGHVKMPYTDRNAWKETQLGDPDLRRVHAHLKSGTRPSKKAKGVRNIRRFLNKASISSDGLLIVRSNEPFKPSRECIVVPVSVLSGLLSSLHLQLSHPTCFQLKKVFSMYFFSLNINSALKCIYDSCHFCASLRKIPSQFHSQSSSDPPQGIGVNFAGDILKRNKQKILVLRETVSSYTMSTHVVDEKGPTIRDAVILLLASIIPLDGVSQVRVDPGPGMVSLVNDEVLSRYGIFFEQGRTKNVNKNPVAESAIEELGGEIARHQPNGGQLSPLSLAIVTSALNSRIRYGGMSAREVWTQRDQYTNCQLPVCDAKLIDTQHKLREDNHPHSAKSKAGNSSYSPSDDIKIGDIIYIMSDKVKGEARDRYLVVDKRDNFCSVRKFLKNHFRKKSYDVKLDECYKVKSELCRKPVNQLSDASSSSDECVSDVDNDNDCGMNVLSCERNLRRSGRLKTRTKFYPA